MNSFKHFFKKFFLEGQNVNKTVSETITTNAPFHVRNRKVLAVVIPAIVVHTIWWFVVSSKNLFYLFSEPSGSFDNPRWYMSITMIFGSMVAGATPEGGGAIAFPVMTLALGVKPSVARDFSFMIQSVGMTASSFTIIMMRVIIELNALIYVSFGGIIGMIIGLEEIAPRLSPPYSKMYFVVIWSSFAFGLFLLNRNYDRRVHDKIQDWEGGVLWRSTLCPKLTLNWKRELLFCFGILGGIFSAMAGSGIDICSFALLTIFFRISEKVATPTSVILMAINTTIGFAYRHFVMGGVERDAWGFFAVCIPIVVIGAPCGAFIGSHWHRLTLAGIIYFIDMAQLIGALYVIRPWTTNKTSTPLHLSLTSTAMFISGVIFFGLLSYFGRVLLERDEERASPEKQLSSTQVCSTDSDVETPPDCPDDQNCEP